MSHQYLDIVRARNKLIASKCHICKKQSTGINAYGYEIKFVCDEHLRREEDLILDTSMPGVLHYTYPNGKKIPEHMMNPNIGGLKQTKDIWATQVSFEE